MWKQTSIGHLAVLSLASVMLTGLGCGTTTEDRMRTEELRALSAEPEEVQVEILLKDQRKAVSDATTHAPAANQALHQAPNNIADLFPRQPGQMQPGQWPHAQTQLGQIPHRTAAQHPGQLTAGQFAPSFEAGAAISTNCVGGTTAVTECAPGAIDGLGYPGLGGPGYPGVDGPGYPGVGGVGVPVPVPVPSVYGLANYPAGYFIGGEFFLTPDVFFSGDFIEEDDHDRHHHDRDDNDDGDDEDDGEATNF